MIPHRRRGNDEPQRRRISLIYISFFSYSSFFNRHVFADASPSPPPPPLRTLKEFVYVDDEKKDLGANVRQKAKDITNLLQDDERLRRERRSRGAMRDRMLGTIADSGLGGGENEGSGRAFSPPQQPRPQQQQPQQGRSRDEDEDLAKALEESRKQEADDRARRAARDQEEDDLARAIRISAEEEARKQREREEANAKNLFDES